MKSSGIKLLTATLHLYLNVYQDTIRNKMKLFSLSSLHNALIYLDHCELSNKSDRSI